MQFSGECRLENGTNVVEFVYVAGVTSVVGTFSVGEDISFGSGAVGLLLDVAAFTYKFSISSTQQPVTADTLTGGTSGATASVATYSTVPDLEAAGVVTGSLFVREGEQIGYGVAGLDTKSRLLLGADYAGVSSDSADGLVHSTRTPNFELPLFDRRDRELQVLLSEAMRRIDNKFQDLEERVTLLE